MREQLEQEIIDYAALWCQQQNAPYLWRRPIVRIGDANHPLFNQLDEVVNSDHHRPQDFLPEANAVISIFIPFTKELASQNLEGAMAAQSWANAYNQTNALAIRLCDHLVDWIYAHGWQAACVADAGMISLENPRSNWSQRHVAYICGQGTWGINNMLISEAGCVGRYYSLVACIPVSEFGRFDMPEASERCLNKENGGCLVCVKRCVNGALTPTSFDRFKCLEQCLINERERGADVCGKCIVGLPCSFIGID